MPNIELNKDDVEAAFKGTNFGTVSHDEVIYDTLLKRMGGYHAGHTAETICKELGLLGSGGNVTKKARQYIYEQTKLRIKKPDRDSMDAYQQQAFQHAFYPHKGNNLVYTMLGLTEEAGEAAGKVKKMLRDNGGLMDEETQDLLIKELGDTLWYIACAAREIDMDLSGIAQANVDKLASRRERGTLRGSGDER